jgi:hypothetical protein
MAVAKMMQEGEWVWGMEPYDRERPTPVVSTITLADICFPVGVSFHAGIFFNTGILLRRHPLLS